MKRPFMFVSLLLWAAVAAASPVTMELVSFDGPFVNGIPTYPYTIQFSAAFPLMGMCDDYYHDGAPGDLWLANLTNLGSGNLTYLRFASSGLISYQEAAWILLQTSVTPSSQWPDMNYAVWHIFNPTVPIDLNSQHWIDLAIANYQGVDYSEVYIATPVQINAPPTGDQEFLFLWKNTNPVPEPGSLVLLATGVLGMFAAVRRPWKN